MTKKTTLKHRLPNGDVVTRTTARAYSHVLLCKVDNAAAIAAYQAKQPERLAYALKDARLAHAEDTARIAAGVGGRVQYSRYQGGYPGYHNLEQYEFDHAVEWNAKRGGTLDGYLAYAVVEVEHNTAKQIAYLAARSEDWQVVSWHSRADLAKPKYEGAGDSYRVEAINGGVAP